MESPTVTQAYAMIRELRFRGGKGDSEKIAELQKVIIAERRKAAQADLEKFFPGKK